MIAAIKTWENSHLPTTKVKPLSLSWLNGINLDTNDSKRLVQLHFEHKFSNDGVVVFLLNYKAAILSWC